MDWSRCALGLHFIVVNAVTTEELQFQRGIIQREGGGGVQVITLYLVSTMLGTMRLPGNFRIVSSLFVLR